MAGHFAGNFRDVPLWRQNFHPSSDDRDYWYMKADGMVGMPNEHRSSAGISDCPVNWDPFYCDTDHNGVWVCGCDSGRAECKRTTSAIGEPDSLDGGSCTENLPSITAFERFWT